MSVTLSATTYARPTLETPIPDQEVVAGEATTITLSDHFGGESLSYGLVGWFQDSPTRHIREINLLTGTSNRVSASVEGDVLTLTGGNASPQAFKIIVTATDSSGQWRKDAFKVDLYSEPAEAPALTGVGFPDVHIAKGERLRIPLDPVFRGKDLAYSVKVFTTHQIRGTTKYAPLNTVGRNKVTGSIDANNVLTLTGGRAVPQTLTLTVYADNE